MCVLLMQEKKVKKSKDTREKHYNGNLFQREHDKRNTKQVNSVFETKQALGKMFWTRVLQRVDNSVQRIMCIPTNFKQ